MLKATVFGSMTMAAAHSEQSEPIRNTKGLQGKDQQRGPTRRIRRLKRGKRKSDSSSRSKSSSKSRSSSESRSTSISRSESKSGPGASDMDNWECPQLGVDTRGFLLYERPGTNDEDFGVSKCSLYRDAEFKTGDFIGNDTFTNRYGAGFLGCPHPGPGSRRLLADQPQELPPPPPPPMPPIPAMPPLVPPELPQALPSRSSHYGPCGCGCGLMSPVVPYTEEPPPDTQFPPGSIEPLPSNPDTEPGLPDLGLSCVDKDSYVKCEDLVVDTEVWGKPFKGFNLSSLTNGQFQYLGCPGSNVGCKPETFKCYDDNCELRFHTSTTDEWPLRALLGPGDVPQTPPTSCATDSSRSVANPPTDEDTVTRLCQLLGYSQGVLLGSQTDSHMIDYSAFTWESYSCPEVKYDGEKETWTLDSTLHLQWGSSFWCKGGSPP